MKIEVYNAKNRQFMAALDLTQASTIEDVKTVFARMVPKMYVERQSFRLEPRGKLLKNNETLKSLGFEDKNGKLYFKDLGPQIGWTTVFITEYSGPLFLYSLFYLRPSVIYGEGANLKPMANVVHIACACWSFHYAKRILETIFVHRFSKGTMPIKNIFKNSSYYWGFTCLVSYFVNHPLYTPASFGNAQIYASLAGFLLCEFGNYSIHAAFRDLRPPGSKERKIPRPTWNPFTFLFGLVSCPNYTYEVGAWACFTIMTQTLTAGLFTVAGFVQMSIWAIQKHKNYRREFKDYPKQRRSIVPFLL